MNHNLPLTKEAALEEAARRFVRKCDDGMALSVVSYAEFKHALTLPSAYPPSTPRLVPTVKEP